METVCKNCVFAEWELPPYQGVQIGCSIDLLDKYAKTTEIVTLPGEDGSSSYFKIENRLCIGCRGVDWAKNFENPIEQLHKEWGMDYTIVLVMGPESKIQDLDKSIENINRLSQKPAKVIVICNNSEYLFSDVRNAVRYLNCKWTISVIKEDYSVEYFIDVASKSFEGIYTSIYAVGYEIRDIYPKLMEKIRINLEQILMVLPDEKDNGLTILNKAYHHFQGMKYDNIIDKIKQEAEKQECQRMIIRLQDL